MNFKIGSLAQPVEQLAFNQLVGRSNRPRPTIFQFFPGNVSGYGPKKRSPLK